MNRDQATKIVHDIIQLFRKEYSKTMQDTDNLSDNFDSLEKIEIGMELEIAVDERIPDETMEGWKTVKDVIDTVEKFENPAK